MTERMGTIRDHEKTFLLELAHSADNFTKMVKESGHTVMKPIDLKCEMNLERSDFTKRVPQEVSEFSPCLVVFSLSRTVYANDMVSQSKLVDLLLKLTDVQAQRINSVLFSLQMQ